MPRVSIVAAVASAWYAQMLHAALFDLLSTLNCILVLLNRTGGTACLTLLPQLRQLLWVNQVAWETARRVAPFFCLTILMA